MPQSKKSEPSPSEWKVLQYVWNQGKSKARAVAEAMEASEGWSTSTTKTLLRRLAQKGHLIVGRGSGGLSYSPARSTRRALFNAGEELLTRAREDTVGALLAHLVRRSDLSSEELAQLRDLVESEERRRSK